MNDLSISSFDNNEQATIGFTSNQDPSINSNAGYYCVTSESGISYLFTKHEVHRAYKRAVNNPEDVITYKPEILEVNPSDVGFITRLGFLIDPSDYSVVRRRSSNVI